MKPALLFALSLLVTVAACGDGEQVGLLPVRPGPDAAGPRDAPGDPDAAAPPADAAVPLDPAADAKVPPPDAAVLPIDAASIDRPDAPGDAGAPDGPLEPPCVASPATVVVTSTIIAPVPPGATATFDVAVTNRDSASCPATAFELHTRSFTAGLTPSPLPGFFTTSPAVPGGEITHLTLAVAASDLLEGSSGSISIAVNAVGAFETLFTGDVEVAVAEETGCHVNIPRALMITDVSVVDDPLRTGFDGPAGDPRTGAWTLKRLVEAMAPTPAQAPAMVESMLTTFTTAQTLNGFTMAPRPRMREMILDAWPRTAGGGLDLRAAPVRLLAIVTRFDLRNLAQGDAGEARFVFGFLSGDLPLQATLIFEYKLPAADETDVLAWARSFHDLGALPFSEEYNAALQAVTDRFAGRGARPGHPNGSAINAVRTNEISFGDDWELRELVLSPSTGLLVPEPVELTPDVSFNGGDVLARFINDNAAAILSDRHVVPDLLDGRPFRGAAVVNDLRTWSAPGILDNEARHHFALNTCSGCHSGETRTSFLHIRPRLRGQRAFLSPFLTGVTATDIITGAPRTFNDLERRRADLQAVVCPPAGALSPAVNLRQGIRRVH